MMEFAEESLDLMDTTYFSITGLHQRDAANAAMTLEDAKRFTYCTFSDSIEEEGDAGRAEGWRFNY